MRLEKSRILSLFHRKEVFYPIKLQAQSIILYPKKIHCVRSSLHNCEIIIYGAYL